MSADIAKIMAEASAGAANMRRNGHDPGVPAHTPWPDPDMTVTVTCRERAPEFPLDVFGAWWGAWIAAAAASKGAPPDFVAAALIAAVAPLLALSRRASPWPEWEEPAVSWVALVGNPSSGKSPAIDAVMKRIAELEGELNLDFGDRRRQWKTDKKEAELKRAEWEKAVATAVKEHRAPPTMPSNCEDPEPVHLRRLIANDATPEKLVRLAAANPYGLLLLRDELAGWLGGMDRYGGAGAERALWLEAFGGRPFTVDRVKDDNPIRCAALAVGICGGIQPDRLATLVLDGDDDGLAARLLYTWPEPPPLVTMAHRPVLASPMPPLARLAGLSAETSTPFGLEFKAEAATVVLPFAPEAVAETEAWRRHVRELEAEASGLLLSWIGKLPGQAARLALILEHLWWTGDRPSEAAPKVISAAAMQAAGGMLESYWLPMARRAFGDAALPQAERDAMVLARWLKAQAPTPEIVNVRALRRARVLSKPEPARYEAALAELAEACWVRPAPSRASDAPGRGRKDWAVNPTLRRLS